MSLILKGVDLPKGDEKLKIEIDPDGNVWIDHGSEWEKREGTAKQIPPHGDLIDRKRLGRELNKRWNVNSDHDFADKEVWRALEEAPAVIEAEGIR